VNVTPLIAVLHTPNCARCMAATSMENAPAVPKKPFGSVFKNKKHRLPSDISIVGLGCSSFSTFFWTKEESLATDERIWTVDCLQENHPRVQEWVQTIQYAVTTAGITLLDTAPWYGHGTSEVVIGWAMNELLQSEGFRREDITINTKIGRYEADPAKQFDFGRDATLKSVQRSLERMKCDYIDVLQLHDPEFAPSLDTLIKDTIPAMLLCQERGWCRALGMTGTFLNDCGTHELRIVCSTAHTRPPFPSPKAFRWKSSTKLLSGRLRSLAGMCFLSR